MTWERCGNTPYYRRYDGGWSYINPFNWSHISIAIERGNEEEGSASILYRRAPGYDRKMLQAGVRRVSEPADQAAVLRSTNGWAVDLTRAKEMNMPIAEVIRIFEGAPKDEQNLVFEGVRGLIQGYDDKRFGEMIKLKNLENPEEGPQDGSVTVIAVEKDSPAYRDIGNLKEFFDFAKRFFIGDTLDQAIAEALAYLGIYEC
jgi:hypothetical protein